MSGLRTFQRNIGVLVSSPNAKVYDHGDLQGRPLWQIEGVKRMCVNPRSEVFMNGRNIAKIRLRETSEGTAYERWLDAEASAIDLEARRLLARRLQAPHRLQNHWPDSPLTMEHRRRDIWNAFAVHYSNGVIPRTLGLQAMSTRPCGLHVCAKAACTFVCKKRAGLDEHPPLPHWRDGGVTAPTGLAADD